MAGIFTVNRTPAVRAVLVAIAAATAAFLLACTLAPGQALANREIGAPTLPDGSTMTVADDITRIHVNKLDAGTHEYVKGAKMQILVEETGEVVDEWTTDGTTHMLEKALDVNVRYVLREVEAPEGYSKVGDTVFIVNEMEGTGITIVSKDEETELSEYYKVTLYDRHDDVEVEVVKTEDRQQPDKVVHVPSDEPTPEKTTTTKKPAKSNGPATGDTLQPIIIGLVVVGVVALAIIVFALARMRRNKRDS